MKTLQAGDAAPDFCLLNQEGQEVCLSDFKGKQKTLVYFYPKASTPG